MIHLKKLGDEAVKFAEEHMNAKRLEDCGHGDPVPVSECIESMLGSYTYPHRLDGFICTLWITYE